MPRRNPGNFDWRGRIQERFRWSKFRWEWGWWYFKTDCMGNTLDAKWVWEIE